MNAANISIKICGGKIKKFFKHISKKNQRFLLYFNLKKRKRLGELQQYAIHILQSVHSNSIITIQTNKYNQFQYNYNNIISTNCYMFRPILALHQVAHRYTKYWLKVFVSCMLQNCRKFLNVLLTYLLTPWSRVLLEKLTSKLCSQSRNSPHLWNPKVPHRTHKCPSPVPVLSQMDPFDNLSSYFFKIHSSVSKLCTMRHSFMYYTKNKMAPKFYFQPTARKFIGSPPTNTEYEILRVKLTYCVITNTNRNV